MSSSYTSVGNDESTEETILTGKRAREGRGWRVRLSQQGAFSGGKLEVAKDGKFFVGMFSDNITIISAATGRVLFTLRPHTEDVGILGEDGNLVNVDTSYEKFTTFCVHPDGNEIVSASENQFLKRWKIGPLVKQRLKEESGQDFTVVPDVSNIMLPSSKLEFPQVIKSWKGHESPVTCADFHSLGDIFATGSSDRSVKCWSLKGGYCTHNFRSHQGIIISVKFHPQANVMRLGSSDSAGGVWLWDLTQQTDATSFSKKKRKQQKQNDQEQGQDQEAGSKKRSHLELGNHVSAVTSICFGSNNLVFTAGRDKVINVWRKNKLLTTCPVLEAVEGMQIVSIKAVEGIFKKNDAPIDEVNCHILATAGEQSIIKYWCFTFDKSGKNHRMTCITQQDTPSNSHPFSGLLSMNDESLVAVRFDNLIQFFDVSSLQRTRQLIGYNDEIIDLQYIPGFERRVVMATNSEHVTLLDLNTSNSELLVGHDAVVMNVDVSKDGKFVLTCSKDATARIWETKSSKCVAICKGHTEAVAAGQFLSLDEFSTETLEILAEKGPRDENETKRRKSETKRVPVIAVTASSDKTIKFWALQGRGQGGKIICKQTQIAHDKDINALVTSPNKALVASASQDKTIKLWNSTDFTLKGTLTGHRRGVWHIQFSPVEKCLASGSADKTIRIWSISDMSCLSVLEGHSSSVIRVQYASNGRQILTGSSNGIMKVWSLRSSECVSTLEHHTDRVWAMARPAVPNGASEDDEGFKEMLSGGADSRLVLWRDCSEELAQLELERQEELLLQEQELFNSIRKKEYIRAAIRALELNRPHQLKSTLETIIRSNLSGQDLPTLVKSLNREQLAQLWELVRDWNMYSRNCAISHSLIPELIKVDIPLAAPGRSKAILDPLLVYSERHFQRLDRLVRDSFLLDHAVACMDGGISSSSTLASSSSSSQTMNGNNQQ